MFWPEKMMKSPRLVFSSKSLHLKKFKLNTEIIFVIGWALFISCIGLRKAYITLENLKYPLFGYGDEFIYVNAIKNLSMNGDLSSNQFGAPFGQNLNFAFLSVDSGPTFLASLLNRFLHNPFMSLNIFYVSTFGLIFLSMYGALRILDCRKTTSFLLASQIPFFMIHTFWATSGITISSFFILPILLAMTFKYLNGFRFTRGKLLFLYGLVTLNGMFYSYYSLGFIFLISCLLVRNLVFETHKNTLNYVKVLSISVLSFLIVSVPSIISYFQTTQINYLGLRGLESPIINSSTLIHFILPTPFTIEEKILNFVTRGNLPNSIYVLNMFESRGIFQESRISTIPLFVIIVSITCYIFFRRNLTLRKPVGETSILKTTHTAILLSFFLSIVGGAGFLISIIFEPILRGYARFAVFVVIFILFQIALTSKYLPDKTKMIIQLMLFINLVFQVVNPFPVQSSKGVDVYQSVKIIEDQMKVPIGCAVLQLPIQHFPYESPGWPTYRLLKFGLLSDKYVWSSGSVGGSPEYSLMEKVRSEFNLKPSNLVMLAKKTGYCGILIDEQAYYSVFNFKPWPEYTNNTPSLESLRPLLMNSIEIETNDGKYYWLRTE